MPAGRPPKTPKDKSTKGTLRKNRVRKTDSKSLEASVYVPTYLDSDERLCWQSFAPVMRQMGMLTVAYAPAFEQFICSWSRFRKLSAIVRRDGMVYRPPHLDTRGNPVLDADGNVVLGTTRSRPEAQLLHAETKILKVWLSAFGLTPADIGRVAIDPPDEKPKDDFELD